MLVKFYIGKKKIFNIAVGAISQKNATWLKSGNDTVYQNMTLFCLESFLDIPLNKEKSTVISAYAGYFNTNYGKNYLRFNGIMNPASASNIKSLAKDAGPMYGNAYPMFGTGQQVYFQLGYLLPKSKKLNSGQLMPYLSASVAQFKRLHNTNAAVFNAGINWLILGNKTKISLDFMNRPDYFVYDDGNLKENSRKNSVILQYQISF